MSELKPCPFDNGAAWVERSEKSGNYAANCHKCKACTAYYETEAEAIEVWNTRGQPR